MSTTCIVGKDNHTRKIVLSYTAFVLYTSLVGVSLSNIYCEVCSVIYILVSDYRIMKLPHIQFVDLAATFDVCSPIVNEMLKYICMHCS